MSNGAAARRKSNRLLRKSTFLGDDYAVESPFNPSRSRSRSATPPSSEEAAEHTPHALKAALAAPTPAVTKQQHHRELQPLAEREMMEDENQESRQLDQDTKSEVDYSVLNHDLCDACREGGELLCCDECPCSFHLECLNPPLEAVPAGDWYCNACESQKNPPPSVPLAHTSFGKLMQRIHYANPTCFSLPQEILLSVTECYERPLMNGLSVDNYSGTIGFRGRRRKKHDDFCYLCGVESQYGDADEDLVRCYRCSHSYHLWCLDPPLLSHPPNHLEWICPVHLNKTQDMCNQKRRGIKYLLPDETFRLDFSEKSRKQHLHTTIQQIVQNDLVTKAEQKEWLQDLLHFETELKRQVLELLHEEEDRPESAEQLQILSLVGENELDLIQNDPAFCPEDDDRAKEDEPPIARHTPSGTARVSLMPKHSPKAIYSFIQFLGMKQLMQWNQDLGQSGEIPLAFRDTLQEYRDQGWQRKAELYLPLVKLLKDLHDELKDDTLNEKKKRQQQQQQKKKQKKKREEAKTLPTQPDLLHNVLAPLDQTNSDKAVSTQHVLVDDKTRRQSLKTNLHEQTAEEAQTEITRCTSASTGNNAATSSTNEAATTTNNQALPEAKPTTNTRKRKGHQDATNQEGHEPTTVAGPHHKRTKTTSGTAAAPVKKTTLRKTTGASQSTQASPSTSSSPVTSLLTPPTTTNIKLTPNNSPTSNHTSTPASLSAQHLDGQVASSSDNQQTTPHTPTPTLPTALSRSPQTPRRGPYGAIEFQSQTHAEAVTIKMNQPKLLLGRYHEESPLVDPTAQFVDLTEYTNRPRVISRIHVTIEFDPQSDKYYVCSGGRNGTTLNGELLQQHKRVPLISGKCIGIADLSLRWKRFKRV